MSTPPMSKEEIVALQKRLQDAEAATKLLQAEKVAALRRLQDHLEKPNQKTPNSKLKPGMSFDSIIREIDFSVYTLTGTQKEPIPVEEGSNAAQTRQTNMLVYALMQEMRAMKEQMTVVPRVP